MSRLHYTANAGENLAFSDDPVAARLYMRAGLDWDIRSANRSVPTSDGKTRCTCFLAEDCPTPGKHPIGKWAEMPPMRPGEIELEFHRRRPWANTALLTGLRPGCAGVVVADVDLRHDGKLATLWELGWPDETPIVRTGSGGWHVYARCPDDGLPSIDSYAPGIEFKANGKLVICPPSIHPNGNPYVWLLGHEPWTMPLADLPESVIQAIKEHQAGRAQAVRADAHLESDEWSDIGLTYEQVREIAIRRYRKAIYKVRDEGEGRNNTCFWLARQLQSLGMCERDIRAWVRQFGEEVKFG